MRYVAAYLLAVLGGNESPKAKEVKKILGSVGIEAEDDKLDKVIKELSGKNITDLMAEGMSKLASMPAGGGAAAAGGGGGGAGEKETAEEKEVAKEESEEESDDDMGFGLFD